MSDPILQYASMWLRRWAWFLTLSLMQAMALWLWVLLGRFEVGRGALGMWWSLAWTPTDGNLLPQVILGGAVVIGVLSTSVVYLLIGKWWRRRGDVHRRGARFDDRAE